MRAKVLSGALLGIDASPVEVDIAQDLPQFDTVRLPEGAVKESKDHVKSAIRNSGFDFPTRRIINLEPADIRKDGAALDLPMAVELLTATGLMPTERSGQFLLMGEFSLRGVLFRQDQPVELPVARRGRDRQHKVARTIADLAGKERIVARHLAEAIQYRTLDRRPPA